MRFEFPLNHYADVLTEAVDRDQKRFEGAPAAKPKRCYKPRTGEARERHILYMRKYMAERKIRKRAERAALRGETISISIDEWRKVNGGSIYEQVGEIV